MKDERIEATIGRISRAVFFFWFALTILALNYRFWILKQHLQEYWDFFAIFCIVSLFGFIALASNGVYAHNFKKYWLSMCIFLVILIFAVQFFMGAIHSVADAGGALIGSLSGLGLVVAIAYFLNRRWKRKEGIEDDK